MKIIPTSANSKAFTLIELLIVIAVIAILVSIVLAVSSGVQEKGRRSKAEAEIAAVAAALESYKADNGDYPTNGTYGSTNPGSANLVAALMPTNSNKVYFEFKQKYTNSRGWLDPWNFNNYHYNYATNGAANNGVNNYDLWSTAGNTNNNTNSWIKNW
jgi:type II secretion system protein G